MKNIIVCALIMAISVAEIAHRVGHGRTLFCAYTYDIPLTVDSWTEAFEDDQKISKNRTVTLDFFIAGFPKTGTSTLLDAFLAHPETVVPPTETNILTTPGSDQEIYDKIMKELNQLAPKTANVKRGIKNPIGLGAVPSARWRSIEYLECLFPETNLIFGVRHPVMYFQSFYNYRVWNYHSGDGPPELWERPIPSVESLLSETWAGVSVESARFETTLQHLIRKPKADESPLTQFKVFLYTIEQIQDKDEERKATFRDELGRFLGLKSPIPPLPHSNKQTMKYNETIDICNRKYDAVRRILVKNGRRTQRWIRRVFLCNPQVTVANEEHFLKLLESFGRDPCKESVQ